jgi:hypothetical protein
MKHYQITVALHRGVTQTREIAASNANEAVIRGLLQMGIVSLLQVLGITIDALDQEGA